MRSKAIPKDPFHNNSEPQVSNVYQGEEPAELRGFDSAKGGINQPPEKLIDENHRSAFKPEPEKQYDFSKRRK